MRHVLNVPEATDSEVSLHQLRLNVTMLLDDRHSISTYDGRPVFTFG